MPSRYGVSTPSPKSGVSSMSDAARFSTSDTVSTTMPIMTVPLSRATWTTMMQVRWVYAISGSPNLRRRSMTGITLPRRLMTPLTYSGVCGTAVISWIPMISRTLRTLMANSSRPSRNVRCLPARLSVRGVGTAAGCARAVVSM